jgi:dipeptidyl aminopeptidase/acylaminoacyl peptidase
MKLLDRRLGTGSLACIVASIVTCLLITVPTAQSQGIRNKVTDPEQHNVRPVTVMDAIEMTKLFGNPAYDSGTSTEHNPALFSPDGTRFVIVTRKGNIEKNTNDYSLLLFHTDGALRSPTPEMLVSLSSSSNRPGIHEVNWRDDRTIAFLGENADEVQQIYEVDCETKRLTKLTSHSTSVIAYALVPNEDRFFFQAYRASEPLFDEKTGRDSVIVSRQRLSDLLAGESRWGAENHSDLFSKMRKGEEETLVRTQGDLVPAHLWLSPNGRYLIGATLVAHIPDIWRDYKDRWVQERVRSSPLHGDLPVLYQYSLIDTQSGQTEALLDAPLGDDIPKVLWSQDSNSVVVSGVYLPLNVANTAERKLRQSKKMIAEIKIPSLEIVPISSRELCSLQCSLRWDPRSGKLVVESTIYSGSSVPDGALLAFQKAGAGWTEVGLPNVGQGRSSQIVVTLEEDMNTPPRLFAKDFQTGQESLLLDFNPQFKDLRFGRVQDVTFKAADGHKVSAGLYLPPDYVKGTKYPLVIQTHAWNPERFWIDGPWPSAFAAQPLAGKGFVVLQLSEDLSVTSTPEEAPREASAYEGSVAFLDNLGVIDRNRVGVIGFSRTGLGVEYALTHSTYRFAAAIIADGSDDGYFSYLSIIPSLPWRWPDFEGLNGGLPFGGGLPAWLKSSSGFNLARVTAPVREEAYHPSSLLYAWEWFAGLSRLDKPVELIYMPNATHVLIRPRDRLTSQQGSVDWFCFWLRDEEDPDSAKAEQYARWRKLRNIQSESRTKPFDALPVER